MAIVVGALVLVVRVGHAQTPAAAAPASSASQLRIARRVMERVRYCALVTIDSTGRASVRTVDPLPPDSSFVVRFATNPRSRKVRELARDGRVTLHYFDGTALAYVSLYGTARQITDQRLKERYWKQEWTPFYRDHRNAVTMYEVKPERMEVVSIKDGVTGDTVTWSPPTIRRFPSPGVRRK